MMFSFRIAVVYPEDGNTNFICIFGNLFTKLYIIKSQETNTWNIR